SVPGKKEAPVTVQRQPSAARRSDCLSNAQLFRIRRKSPPIPVRARQNFAQPSAPTLLLVQLTSPDFSRACPPLQRSLDARDDAHLQYLRDRRVAARGRGCIQDKIRIYAPG